MEAKQPKDKIVVETKKPKNKPVVDATSPINLTYMSNTLRVFHSAHSVNNAEDYIFWLGKVENMKV